MAHLEIKEKLAMLSCYAQESEATRCNHDIGALAGLIPTMNTDEKEKCKEYLKKIQERYNVWR